jgi:PncC family amidohydrolase
MQIEKAIQRALTAQKKTLALAESVTGGAIAARLSSLPGASDFFLGSIVAYSNVWKQQFLGVPATLLEREGAVSLACVQEMMRGLFVQTEADYALAISGFAGPQGGTSAAPIGTIYLAIGERDGPIDAGKLEAPAGREAAIAFAVDAALGALLRRLAHGQRTFS